MSISMNVETLQNFVNQDIVIGVITADNLHSVAQGTNMQLIHNYFLQPLAHMCVVLLLPSILESITVL